MHTVIVFLISIMRRNNRIAIVFCFIIPLIPGIAFTQDDAGDEEITVVAPYEPTISTAVKIARNPEIREEKVSKPEFSYELKPAYVETQVEFDSILPAKLRTQTTDLYYKNMVKAGFGNYLTSYAELWANNFQSKNLYGGFHLKHLSSAGNIKDYAFPGNSTNEADAYGKLISGKLAFEPGIYWSRNTYHFYGYKPDDYPLADIHNEDLRQVYNLFGIKTSLSNTSTRADELKFRTGIRWNYLADRFDSKEHRFGIDGSMNKSLDIFNFPDEQYIKVKLDFELFSNSDTLKKSANSMLKFNPVYNIKYRQYSFYGGFNAMFQLDSISYLRIYPEFGLSVEVIKNKLITFAGIEGDLTRNSLYSLSNENPFISTTSELLFSNKKFAQFGGIRGSFAHRFDYRASFHNSTIEQLPLFVNDTISYWNGISGNQFRVVYDKAKYSQVEVNLAYHLRNNLDITGIFRYNSYFMDNEDRAWHKPQVEVVSEVKYRYSEALTLRGNIGFYSGMYALTYEKQEKQEIKLKSIADLSLMADYKITRQLSAFLNINNVTNARHSYWYNYPGYRLNVLGGVGFRF